MPITAKKVATLGAFPLPVEVVPFGVKSTAMKLEHAGKWAGCEGSLALRVRDGELFVTDNGNVIIDCAFGTIPDAQKLASVISTIPGVVDHGLFIGMAGMAILGGPRRSGNYRKLKNPMSEYDYDLFVIGGGSGGVRAARIAANHGARVGIAEEYRYGGTCVIRGCVPKKLFVYASQFAESFEDAIGFGWSTKKVSVRLVDPGLQQGQGGRSAQQDLHLQP